jgi:hypothetical protein
MRQRIEAPTLGVDLGLDGGVQMAGSISSQSGYWLVDSGWSQWRGEWSKTSRSSRIAREAPGFSRVQLRSRQRKLRESVDKDLKSPV